MDYDYVIVGAGSAGAALAARLSEDPSVRVALLEAGGTDRKQEIHIPAAFTRLFKTTLDWDFQTARQPGLDGREIYWPRGRMLGGSSSMNAMMWARGTRADYDGWDVPGWTYDDVLPYFRRAEGRVGSNTGDVYGTDGPVTISEQRDPNVTTRAFLQTCENAGLTRLDELNGPDNEGYSIVPVSQRRGRRWSTADAYLRPARRRRNLRILTNAQVARIMVEDGRAVGVRLARGGGVNARREVVLSAGAVGSPHLLMLSGIGDAGHLREHGVEPVVERSEVGRHLQDHLAIMLLRHCPEPVTLVGAGSRGDIARYLLLRRGPFTSNVGEGVVYARSGPEQPAPDLELVFAPVPLIRAGLDEPTEHGVTLGVVLLRPESSGRIALASDDPYAKPLIDPGYLSAPGDLPRLVTGLRMGEKLLDGEPVSQYATRPMTPHREGDDDAALRAYVRAHAETLFHPTGTCRMGTDEDSVVDPDLRVRGVDGLRVADASILPEIIRGHTNAPSVMIGEYAADIIRRT
ncbi:GMC family oxidoreductase [Actinomadura oligospora]|uniref:GMC family oxidoreductase n=1 Tax=Actinomadura oligospora TaxID=111804 RepID=UPI000479FFDA|nr:GMC family oxidoreductase N-terminal domain-containing protein [Actinomadura oligospora]